MPFEKKMGATKEKIREATFLTITVIGLKGADTTLASVLETYDKA